MAEKDASQKILIACDDIFADIFNVLLADGEELIRPEDLSDAQTFSQYKFAGGAHQQDRDVAKFWAKGGVKIAFCGIENQSARHANMAARVLSYDAAAYRAQLSQDQQAPLYPVISLVLNFGEEPWGNPRSLKESIRFDGPAARLEKYVNDYPIRVFDMAFLEQSTIDCFRSEFRVAAQFLRDRRLGRRFEADCYRQALRHTEAVIDFLQAIGTPQESEMLEAQFRQISGQEGGFSMLSLLGSMKDEYIAQGVSQGFSQGVSQGFSQGVSQGFSQGISKNQFTVGMKMFRQGYSPQAIADLTELPFADVEAAARAAGIVYGQDRDKRAD